MVLEAIRFAKQHGACVVQLWRVWWRVVRFAPMCAVAAAVVLAVHCLWVRVLVRKGQQARARKCLFLGHGPQCCKWCC